MDFNVQFTNQAAYDLDEILRYISEELYNQRAAENFYKAVNKKISQLNKHPFMFPLYHDEKLRAEGCRFAVIGNYLMLYFVDESAAVVNVARILYGRQDIPTAFSQYND
jgi:addiction module RelE/StbE family toxin